MKARKLLAWVFRSNCKDEIVTAMTNISGYFNANPWPLILWISELNLQIQVLASPPNQFVQDSRGNRVNDPILDKYCGPKMLQREVSPTPVPVRSFTRNPNAASSDERKSPVTSAAGFATDPNGRTIAVPQEIHFPAPAVPMAATNPVKGLTIDQAKRLGLIRPTKQVPEDFGATETTGVPGQGQTIPEIEYAHDVGPRAAKQLKLNEELTRPPAQVAKQPARQALLKTLSEGVGYDPDAPNLPEIVTRRTNIGLPAAGPVVDPRQVPTPVTTQVEQELPEPDFGEETTPLPAPPAPKMKNLPFACMADDRRFTSREELLIYVTETYPDQVTELMEHYPAVPRKRQRTPVPPPPAETA